GPGQLPRWQQAIASAKKTLKEYEERLIDTIVHKRDPDRGFNESVQVEALRGYFGDLEEAINHFFAPRISRGLGQSPLDDPAVNAAINNLNRTSGDLRDAIYQDMGARSLKARDDYRVSIWITCSVSIVGTILLCSLLRFFYGWVFYPIRDLEAGASKLAQGDFQHRIDVHSGDELEDLARTFNDMTARLRDIYGDLAQQVNERSRQLVRSERLVSVGFLAAGVAHEINNPLASIAFCSEALEQRLTTLLQPGHGAPPGSDEREVVNRYLNMIQQEAFRCKEITQRLLEFSRGSERSREPTNLAETIQSVLDITAHLENSKGKSISFEPAGKVVAWVNGPEIKSVVLNLVVNALDSMVEGGTLRIALGQRDGMAVLEFADSGCGMTAEVLENIFEPFYTRSRTGKGTGLGLSISHRIISGHGGEIEATSAGLNKGSTFTVRLPLRNLSSSSEPVKEGSFGHVAA
ncbi:MAG: sensor histidine kinase, partial [Gemmataceae bacterium]